MRLWYQSFQALMEIPLYRLDGDLVLVRAFGTPWMDEAPGRLWKLDSKVGGVGLG